MKKTISIITAVFGLLIFSACNNPFDPPQGRGPEIPAGLGEGMGVVRIDMGIGVARTAMPAAVFDHYEYWFSKGGAAAVKIDPYAGTAFELEAGSYTVTVKAYAGPGSNTLAAEGTSGAFTVSAGEDAGTISVTIQPAVSEGTGTFSYTLTYPAGVTVDSYTLTLLAGSSTDLISGSAVSGTDPLTRSGTKTVNAGYYLAQVKLTKNGLKSGKSEIVHIYKNMATPLEWTFVEANFTAIRVYSSANSGPGTLREALTNAVSGNTIFIDLPENDKVITLTTPLPEINKSLTIEGNGATLTQSGFTPSATSQLLRITSIIEVSINRLHFKGGRATNYGGAINNGGGSGTGNYGGKLNLQSCIFSDNRTTATSAEGGAIHIKAVALSYDPAIVSGCTFYGNFSNYRGGAIYVEHGYVTLTGNIFWKNTAWDSDNVCSYTSGYGRINTGGYNISDNPSGWGGSGWTFAGTDKNAAALPISTVSYKPLAGRDALNVIDSRPADYPLYDFYGAAIPALDVASGAVQTQAVGYVLECGAAGTGTVSISSGPAPNSDGLYTGGILTLQANPGSGMALCFWTIDGIRQGEQSPANQISFTMDGHKTAEALFGRLITVTNTNNSGTGSFRTALTNPVEWDVIRLPAGQTITLTSPLPDITKNIIIEGNGATLTQSGFTPSDTSQLLRITEVSADVIISRLHFKGGRAANSGGAIRSDGKLSLRSCIISDSRTLPGASSSGAIMTGGKNGDTALTVSGCTFYGNQTGAIYWSSGPITLTGNIFWGNGNIDRYGVTSGGYNVFDMASSSTFGVTDNQITTIPISPVNYKPLTGSGAWEHISSRPQDYPVLDFYGVPIPASNAASGAVQTQAAAGYTLEYGVNGKGTISISGPAPNSDGLYAGGSILTLQASPGSGSVFGYWTINGLRQEEQTPPNQISLTMNAHNNVKATFGWVVNNANSGSGSLREALTNQEDEQFIYLPAGQTITLASPLPAITKNISIEGNGATLTQSGFTSDYGSMLLRISNSNAEVVIRHLHFKGGRAVEGAAIRTEGKLSVESCIFSDNQASRGGALYCATSSGTLIVSGCTFYGNTAVVTVNYAYGGAIYVWQGSLTLTGNIFMGNTSSTSTGKVVYNSGGTVSSGGYNVSDYASGTNTTTGSGWTFALTDIQVTDTAFNIAWQPTSATTPLNIITSLPTGFPATYFDGSTRTIPATPGAMPQL